MPPQPLDPQPDHLPPQAEVGLRLFERDRCSVNLSPDGLRFSAFVSEVLGAWESYRSNASELLAEVTGTVKVFCTVTASQTIVPAMLARFRTTYPGVHLALETGYAADALARLDDGSADLTVAAPPPRVPRHLLSHAITTTSLVLVAPAGDAHGLTPQPSPSWSDVPFVLPASGLTRTLMDRWFRRARVHPTVAAGASGHEAVLSLVSLGCGIGIVPELVASQSPLGTGLEILDVDASCPGSTSPPVRPLSA